MSSIPHKTCHSYAHSCFLLSLFTSSRRNQRPLGTESLHSHPSLQFLFTASPAGGLQRPSPLLSVPSLPSTLNQGSNSPSYVFSWSALHLLKARPTLNSIPSHTHLLGLPLQTTLLPSQLSMPLPYSSLVPGPRPPTPCPSACGPGPPAQSPLTCPMPLPGLTHCSVSFSLSLKPDVITAHICLRRILNPYPRPASLLRPFCPVQIHSESRRT